MILQVPIWMTLVIVFTYALLILLVTAGVRRALKTNETPGARGLAWSIGLYLTGWFLLVVILGTQGFFKTGPAARAPRIAFALIPFVLAIGWSLVSPIFRKAVGRIPQQWIIGVQANRILGALFLVSYFQGGMPGQFAIPAGVGDVLVSLAAPGVAYLFAVRHRRARSIGLLWNAFGVIDLLTAITLGVLTSPGPFHRLALDAPNLLMSVYPFVVIPAFGVPVWLLLHYFSMRGIINPETPEAFEALEAPARRSVLGQNRSV